jgi:hypothetical protein
VKSLLLDDTVDIIFDELEGVFDKDNYTEYSAAKSTGERKTQSRFRYYETEKLSRIVLEQYEIKSKMHGVVFNIYPQPEYGIPIFTYQLGGSIPERVIFVLDIIPTVRADVPSELRKQHQKFVLRMQSPGATQDWIKPITSEQLLVCQYEPLDPELIREAVREYARIWRRVYYTPAEATIGGEQEKRAVEKILEFKRVLHANDAGLAIYERNFGKKMVRAIEEAAFGSEPSITDPVGESNVEPEIEDESFQEDGTLIWTERARDYVQEAPAFVRGRIRRRAEKKAQELGIDEITWDFVNGLRE